MTKCLRNSAHFIPNTSLNLNFIHCKNDGWNIWFIRYI